MNMVSSRSVNTHGSFHHGVDILKTFLLTHMLIQIKHVINLFKHDILVNLYC